MSKVINGIISQFTTTDLPLIAFLKCRGVKISNVVAINQNQCQFTFENVSRQLLNDFNCDLESVEPKEYARVMRDMIQTARRVCAQF